MYLNREEMHSKSQTITVSGWAMSMFEDMLTTYLCRARPSDAGGKWKLAQTPLRLSE